MCGLNEKSFAIFSQTTFFVPFTILMTVQKKTNEKRQQIFKVCCRLYKEEKIIFKSSFKTEVSVLRLVEGLLGRSNLYKEVHL